MDNFYIKIKNKPFAPVYVPGENYSFYINFDVPITDPDFDNFQLHIYRGNVRVATNIGALHQDLVQGVAYNIYALFVFPALAPSYYQFVIWNNNGNVEMARSSFIMCEPDPLGYNNAPKVLFRNEENRNNINYEGLPDFFQIFRLPMTYIDYQYELTKTQYRNASDQRLRNLKSFKYKYRKIEAYYFDEAGHDAAAEMFEHDGIYIDDLKYVTKDGYSVNTDQESNVAKGSVNCYIDNVISLYKFPISTIDILEPVTTGNMTKHILRINDGAQQVINWQADFVPDTTLTWFQLHGDNPTITEEDQDDDGNWIPNGTPSIIKVIEPSTLKLISVTFNPQVPHSIFNII